MTIDEVIEMLQGIKTIIGGRSQLEVRHEVSGIHYNTKRIQLINNGAKYALCWIDISNKENTDDLNQTSQTSTSPNVNCSNDDTDDDASENICGSKSCSKTSCRRKKPIR